MATAFVIMQIGKQDSNERRRADQVLQYVISPVLREPKFNLEVIRADLVIAPGSISPKMLSDLISAQVVIADLTGRNPNVFYELGIAHAFEKAVISLGQPSGLPFDVQDERVIPLPGPEEKLGVDEAEKARSQLAQALQVVLSPDYRPISPLTQVASRRALDELAPSDPIAAELTAIREKLEEVSNKVAQGLGRVYIPVGSPVNFGRAYWSGSTVRPNVTLPDGTIAFMSTSESPGDEPASSEIPTLSEDEIPRSGSE